MKLLAVKKTVLYIGVLSLILLPSYVWAQEGAKGGELSVGAETKKVPEKKDEEPVAEPNQTNVSAEGPAVAASDEEKKKDSKWWGLSFGYSFSHNLAKERPMFVNSFSIDPSARAPYGINFGLHLGMSVTTRYPSGIIGGSDIHTNDVDMDPIVLNISKRFVIDEKYTGFAVNLSLGQIFPFTSISARQVWHFYYAIKPGVSLSIGKKGFNFSVGTSLQRNVHTIDSAKTYTADGTTWVRSNTAWIVRLNSSLSYNFWKMHVGINGSWGTQWVYWSGANKVPNNNVSFGGSIGIAPYEGLDVTLGITTAGPERRNGGFGEDHLIPLDPQFTNGYLSISYSI